MKEDISNLTICQTNQNIKLEHNTKYYYNKK